MISLNSHEKTISKNHQKKKHRELLIIPKKDFKNWYQHIRNQNQEIGMKKRINETYIMEYSNCRETMEDYHLKNLQKKELWHLCTYCNLTFSHNQYNRFTEIIQRAINSKNRRWINYVKKMLNLRWTQNRLHNIINRNVCCKHLDTCNCIIRPNIPKQNNHIIT